MPSKEFSELAKRVSNWGRWGPEDERGTLNLITPEAVRRGAAAVREGRSFSLGLPFGAEGPQTGAFGRFNPHHYMTVLGQRLGSDPAGFCYSDDMIHMPLQCATQWDALAHVHYEGKLYNGYPVAEVLGVAGASRDGIDKAAQGGILSRGILLDVARLHGALRLPASHVVTPADLDAAARAGRVAPASGDVVLVRTGHIQTFTRDQDRAAFAGPQPGLGMHCAAWLHEHGIAALCADNVAVEPLPGSDPANPIPLHMLCLRDMGLMLGEMFDLEELALDCARDGRFEFLFCAPPLPVTRGIGSPINPLVVK
jgi:kynurenine formamidase